MVMPGWMRDMREVTPITKTKKSQKLNFSFGSRRSYEVETLQIQGPLYIAARILAL